MSSDHLVLCHLLLPPSIFPSIRVFSNESVLCIRWPKYWSVSFSISPSIEYSGLIAFRMDWLDLLAVQGTLKSLLQHHNSEASVFRCSAFLFFVTPVEVLVGAVKVGRSDRVRDALLPSQLNLLMDWIQECKKKRGVQDDAKGFVIL